MKKLTLQSRITIIVSAVIVMVVSASVVAMRNNDSPLGSIVEVSAVETGQPLPLNAVEHWQQAALQAAFPVFMPSYVPSGLVPGWPSYDAQVGFVVQNYRSKTNSSALLIIQGPAPVVQRRIPGTPVHIGALKGYYREEEKKHTLVLKRASTRIEVQASPEVKKDELLQIVGSMQPVPLTTTSTPIN